MMETQVVNLLLTGAMQCWKEKVISTISPTQWKSLKPRVGYRAQAEHRASWSCSKRKGMQVKMLIVVESGNSFLFLCIFSMK